MSDATAAAAATAARLAVSGAATAAPPAAPPPAPLPYSGGSMGPILVSTLAMLIYGGALVIAFLSKDQGNLTILIGVAAANATTVVGYWVGSSIGSARKDVQLAAAALKP